MFQNNYWAGIVGFAVGILLWTTEALKLESVGCTTLWMEDGWEVTPIKSVYGYKGQRCFLFRAWKRAVAREDPDFDGEECPVAKCNLGTQFKRTFTVTNQHLRFSHLKPYDGKFWAQNSNKKFTWAVPLPGVVTDEYNGEFSFRYCEKLLPGAVKKFLPGKHGEGISGSWPCYEA